MSRNYTESVTAGFTGPVRIRFEFCHSTAKRVCVAGSFNGWSSSTTPLAATGKGRWLRDLWLPPGAHEYLFVVDGAWVFDPKATDYVPNIFGGMNTVIHARSPAPSAANKPITTAPSFGGRETRKGKASPSRVEFVECFA